MRILGLIIFFCLLSTSVMAVNTEKNFGGVGIDGQPLPDGQIRVGQIVAGGPAYAAGIKVGDVITHIDGKPTRGSSFQQMVQKRLRGVSGTKVVLKVQRKGAEKPLTFTLVRKQLILNP